MMLTKHRFLNNLTKKGGVTALLLSSVVFSAPANALSYNIGWTGSSGYTLDGSFSFDDSLANTGPITFAALDSFTFTTRLNGGEIETFTTADTFNFDTTTQQFAVGGNSFSISGQRWGIDPSVDGFQSGSANQGILVGGAFLGGIPVSSSTLTATLATEPVPFEFSPALGLTVVGGLWFGQRFLKAKKSSKN